MAQTGISSPIPEELNAETLRRGELERSDLSAFIGVDPR
jgi:hypothetical protein